MNKNLITYLRITLTTAIGIILILKSGYKLLGFGTPISTFWYCVYGSTFTVCLVGLPMFLYRSFTKINK